ncbi:MAG: TetR/AcrR family transcriptional regulator [Bacteroidales bacterium]|nr:TetR/AcrR family transcriptional regulator [Bacteroidales bacterium]
MATDESRKKIVETAMQLFNSRGIRGVTMDDIAAALRISKRTLYETFANKEELLAECLMDVHDGIEKRHREVYLKVDEPLLVALYMIEVNAMSNHSYCHLIEEAERYYPELHDRFFKIHTTAFREMIAKALNYAKAQGYLRPAVDIDTTVDFMCQFVQQHRITEASNSGEYAQKMNELSFTFLRGLMSTETIVRYEKQEEKYRQIMKKLNETYN